jgi:phosphoglycolate phosphatase
LVGVLIRHVISDWSGTLVDDLLPVFKTTNHVLQACQRPAISLDEFREEFCLPIRKFYERQTPDVPLATLAGLFFAKYAEWQDEIQVLPQTMAFLEFCRQRGLGIYIASTVDAASYSRQAGRFGIDRYIARPYLGIEDKTAAIHQILAENRLDPAQTLFIGDMEHDIEAGQAGGVHTCAVLTGYTREHKLRALRPDLVCRDLGELQQRLAAQELVYG